MNSRIERLRVTPKAPTGTRIDDIGNGYGRVVWPTDDWRSLDEFFIDALIAAGWLVADPAVLQAGDKVHIREYEGVVEAVDPTHACVRWPDGSISIDLLCTLSRVDTEDPT